LRLAERVCSEPEQMSHSVCCGPLAWHRGRAGSALTSPQAPSPTMFMKKSFPLLRAIGLSAGLMASTAMMARAEAATSGAITATGSVPAVCSVTGANIAMSQLGTMNGDYSFLSGSNATLAPISTNGNNTTFTLSSVSLTKPTGSNASSSSIEAFINPVSNVTALSSGKTIVSGSSFTATTPFDSTVTYSAKVKTVSSSTPLTPGTYTLSSTLTCIDSGTY